MCALGGGKLWQHVDNHAIGSVHEIVYKGKTYLTNSYHHQMMRPTEEMEIIAHTPKALSPKKYNEDGEHLSDEVEAEIVYIPKMKALCVQGHPEWLTDNSDLCKIMKEELTSRNFL